MKDDYYQNKNRGGDTFFAFMTGLLLGTVAVLMSNRDNRDKVKKTLDDVTQKGKELTADTARKAEETTGVIEKRVREVAEKAQENANGEGSSRKSGRSA